MPKFLERKLKAEYGTNSAVPYKVMNAIGVMRGNKETPKGAAMEAKHERKLHPKMQQRAAQVKASHAHLTQNVLGFAALSGLLHRLEIQLAGMPYHILVLLPGDRSVGGGVGAPAYDDAAGRWHLQIRTARDADC